MLCWFNLSSCLMETLLKYCWCTMYNFQCTSELQFWFRKWQMASCLGLSRETRKSAKLPSLTSQFLTFSSWSWALSGDQSILMAFHFLVRQHQLLQHNCCNVWEVTHCQRWVLNGAARGAAERVQFAKALLVKRYNQDVKCYSVLKTLPVKRYNQDVKCHSVLKTLQSRC